MSINQASDYSSKSAVHFRRLSSIAAFILTTNAYLIDTPSQTSSLVLEICYGQELAKAIHTLVVLIVWLVLYVPRKVGRIVAWFGQIASAGA
jgi:hypothetical protein